MRLSAPRIPPVDLESLSDDQRAALAPYRGMGTREGGVLNIFRTLAQAPEAMPGFGAWGGYVLSDRNSLPPRDRELVILRTGFNCRSGYEFTQHAEIGQAAGLTAEEVEAVKAGPEAALWSARDRAMLCATDDLTRDFFVSEESWAALSFLTDRQKMDLVMTVGQYTQVSMMLNSFGVQLDDGQTLDPALDHR